MQDYIAAHRDEKIGLSEPAGVSLFSPWNSYRLFQKYTDLTPSAYIRRLRLVRAALRIKNEHIHLRAGHRGRNGLHRPIPEGFDVINLPAADYLMFQGEPFAEENYCDTISAVQQAMNGYAPGVIGYAWDDSNPRIQLEPRGSRRYIELRAVKKI